MYMLLYPLRYFSLENNTKKRIDTWPTWFLAVLLALPYWIIPGASFFRPNGFIDKILTLTSCLTGFYVAALVAAATFSSPDLDKVIRSGSIALISKGDDGKKVSEALSRRQFACYIFGYLSFLSLVISVVAAFAISMTGIKLKNIGISAASAWFEIFRNLSILGVTVMVAHLVVVTSLGLYYLMDRLYRKDRKITTPKNIDDERAA